MCAAAQTFFVCAVEGMLAHYARSLRWLCILLVANTVNGLRLGRSLKMQVNVGGQFGNQLLSSLRDSSFPGLCLQATSKTTTINDPTAGMTPDEIESYMSNVGGGLCNAPEAVRAAVGLGLNFSLIIFGLFTVSYVILGGLNFALTKQVDEQIEGVLGETGSNKKTFGDMAKDAWNAPLNTKPPPGSRDSDGPSRDQRRLQRRLKKDE